MPDLEELYPRATTFETNGHAVICRPDEQSMFLSDFREGCNHSRCAVKDWTETATGFHFTCPKQISPPEEVLFGTGFFFHVEFNDGSIIVRRGYPAPATLAFDLHAKDSLSFRIDTSDGHLMSYEVRSALPVGNVRPQATSEGHSKVHFIDFGLSHQTEEVDDALLKEWTDAKPSWLAIARRLEAEGAEGRR